jgi:hypothetical protein
MRFALVTLPSIASDWQPNDSKEERDRTEADWKQRTCELEKEKKFTVPPGFGMTADGPYLRGLEQREQRRTAILTKQAAENALAAAVKSASAAASCLESAGKPTPEWEEAPEMLVKEDEVPADDEDDLEEPELAAPAGAATEPSLSSSSAADSDTEIDEGTE